MEIKTIQSKQIVPLIDSNEKTFFEIYADLVEKHDTINILQIDTQNFIIKSIGRKEFKEIMLSDNLNQYLKEEAICELCTLYPENYNFELSDAGIASKIYDEILKLSFLKKNQEEDRQKLMSHFRSEMVELHNQISCMISEAFPSLNFEEIENFDIPKTLKYLSRAEWILQNLRGFEILHDPFTGEAWDNTSIEENSTYNELQEDVIPEPVLPKQSKPQPEKVLVKKEAKKGFIAGESVEERIARVRRGEIEKDELSREKLQLLQRQYPEIDWTAKNSEDDFRAHISSTPVALRAGDELYREE